MVHRLEVTHHTEVNSTLRAHLMLFDVTGGFSVYCTGKQLRPRNCGFRLLSLLTRVTVSWYGSSLSQWMSLEEGKVSLTKGSVR